MLFEKVTIMELKLVTSQQLYNNNAQREITLTYKKMLYRRLLFITNDNTFNLPNVNPHI